MWSREKNKTKKKMRTLKSSTVRGDENSDHFFHSRKMKRGPEREIDFIFRWRELRAWEINTKSNTLKSFFRTINSSHAPSHTGSRSFLFSLFFTNMPYIFECYLLLSKVNSISNETKNGKREIQTLLLHVQKRSFLIDKFFTAFPFWFRQTFSSNPYKDGFFMAKPFKFAVIAQQLIAWVQVEDWMQATKILISLAQFCSCFWR